MFNPFFIAVIKGDLRTIRDFFRRIPLDEMLRVIDSASKSPLHHSAREGQIGVTDYLITRGYLVNARERTLKTPLHYAAQFGHSILADNLLKNGADITAKDVSGRTAFHFGCSSWSSETISLLLGLKPEQLNLGDNKGRVGQHYSVWNSSESQIDIIRTLIERKADINRQDDDGKTAQHHASEGGRLRAIPILIQRGADMAIREKTQNKTPLESAKNERTRELMVVYSSVPYVNTQNDLNFLNNAVKGNKVQISKEDIYGGEKLKTVPKSKGLGTPMNGGQLGQTMVAEFLREKCIKILEKLQEMGIKSNQHVKRPYLFTGSWLEGVSTIEQLYDRIKDLTPNECMLRLFNVLHPYAQTMPNETGDEVSTSKFYGEYYNFDVDQRQDMVIFILELNQNLFFYKKHYKNFIKKRNLFMIFNNKEIRIYEIL